jgi:uncharacterized membrane protein
MSESKVPGHVHENIESLAQLRASIEGEISRHQRAIESAARALGKPRTLYVLLGIVVAWVAYNTLASRHGWPCYDAPPFFWLQGVIALYAAAITTMILIAQSRQARDTQHAARLEFHVNLLAEQKATKIIALLEELRRDLPNVRDRTDAVAEEMQQEVDPRAVHRAIR